MANDPLRRGRPRQSPPSAGRPKIWAEGEQRPPFSVRGLRRAMLRLARDAAAPLDAWTARTLRRVALNVADGAGRIPAGKVGRAERFVPSHLRVAGWIKTCAAVMAHASAVADPDVIRGNALVAEIEPHLWPTEADPLPPGPMPKVDGPAASPFGADAPPVVLAEPRPDPQEPEPDPLAAIRDDLEGTAGLAGKTPVGRPHAPPGPQVPPSPPGPIAATAIQMAGYLIGWATVMLALPYGLVRALWLWMARNVDLRKVGQDD